MNIDAHLHNADWPKHTPDTFAALGLTQKFDPQQRRDQHGRWVDQATITVDGRDITVVKPARATKDKLVLIDVAKWDANFKAQPSWYVGPEGEGGMRDNVEGTRYKTFGKYLAEHDSIEASEVGVQADGTVGFTNGRHRYAYLRDHGVTQMPVSMDSFSLAYAKKHGYLVEQAQKQEHKYGNTQIPIAPTSSAATSLNMARDTIRDEHLMGTGKDVDPNHVTVRFGLLNDNLGALRTFLSQQQAFEAHLGLIELFPVSEHSDGAVPVVARIESPELEALEAEIGKYAAFKEKSFPVYKPHCTLAYCKPEAAEQYADLIVLGSFVVQAVTISHASGVKETIPFGRSQKWDANQPRDAKGRWTGLGLHEGSVTVLHGTTQQNAEAILAGGFKPGNPAGVAAQVEREYGLPEGSVLNHVAFEFARGRRDLAKVHFTTDESVADQYAVPEVMQDALTAAHMLLHPFPEDQPFTKADHAARKMWIAREAQRLTKPALLAVTVPFETVGQHSFGKQFTLEEFKALLAKFPTAPEDIFNNITIPIDKLTGARVERWKWDGSRHPRDDHGQFTEVAAALARVAQSPAFKAWFGNSKVVDKQGKPLVMWRGDLPAREQLEKSGGLRRDVTSEQIQHPDVLEAKPAIYLTPDEDRAYYFATSVGYENYARPFFVKAEKIATPEILRELVQQQPAGFDGNPERRTASDITAAEVALLQHHGYDALQGSMDWPGGGGAQEIAVFSSTQVKGVENLLFDPKNPHIMKREWDPRKHPRGPGGTTHGGEFIETLHGPRDALDSLLNKETDVNIDRNDVRRFLELAGEQFEDPDMTKLHVEGTELFGGNGLGIERDDMPQIPPEHRQAFLQTVRNAGVLVTEEVVDPHSLKPTQNQISARRVAEKLAKYERKRKEFPRVLTSNQDRVLDGHHHWGMMAALALEVPGIGVPIYRLHTTTKMALALMHAYMKQHDLHRESLSGAKVAFDPNQPRDAEGQWTETGGGLTGEAAVAAIRRGEPHLASEKAFVDYHNTGYIESNAYTRYETEGFDYTSKTDFKTLLETRTINGEQVEIRLQAEPLRYAKWIEDAPGRDKLYEEYVAAAKALGTSPMMAGIDLGHDSPEYAALDKQYAKPWLDAGEHWARDEKGDLIYYTPEEVAAQGKPELGYTVGAFVGDKAIGYAGDEFGATGVYLMKSYQRHGLGLTLLKTYLEKSGKLAKGTKIGQMTPQGRALTQALHRQLVRESGAKKADPATGRYVTPFVSFDKQGDEQLRMIASLNSSRLATWGFTAEAEVLGMARYRLTAVLDGRTSTFCRFISGKIFNVSDARRKVIEALNVQDPNDLKTVQPWPKQDKASMAAFAQMSNDELMQRGLHIPPYHPHCRTLLRHIASSKGKATEPPVPTVPDETEVFQPVTAEDLKELGVEATPEQVAQWNDTIGMSPVELISKLTTVPPREILTKGQGVGATPVVWDAAGNVGVKARGQAPNGIEFKLGALLDPFTGIYYLTEAALTAGTPKAEVAFLKNLFTELINTGLQTSATSVAVGVAGNAAAYARMGFLPDDLDWDAIRHTALGEMSSGALQPVLASLSPLDQQLVLHLLQDQSASALQALVELPFIYEGHTIGEWILAEATGTWGLDLMDADLVAHAKAVLS